MIKVMRLFAALFSMSLRRSLTFRADLLFEVGLTALVAASSLAALGLVYTRTDTLAGWTAGEAIVLLGTFQIVSGLRATFVEPNIEWFAKQVKDGDFDAILIQPAPSIFLASLGTSAPLAITEVVLGLGVVIFGLDQAGTSLTLAGVLAWLVLLIAATVVMWATRVLLAAIVFWALGLSLDVVYDAIWQFARYPVHIYRHALQLILTYVLPVALIATVPADVLTSGGGVHIVPVALAIALVASLVAIHVWRRGLRRYTSATS